MQNRAKIFKGWNLFEYILFFGGNLTMLLLGIIFHSDWTVIVSSTICFCSCFLSAKGKIAASFIGLIFIITYSLVSYKNQYYGEIIISLCVMLPMYIWQIVEWVKHRDKEENVVIVNKIGMKEVLILLGAAVLAFVVFYFLLKALNTANLIVSTISILGNVMGMYLLIRRSKLGFISFFVDDVVYFLLWFIPMINGNITLLPIVINPVLNLVSDIYGLRNWTKIQKIQSKNKENNL